MLAPRTFVDPVRPVKVKKGRYRIPHVSPRKAAENRLYSLRAKRFKDEHPVCEVCGVRRTNDVHHKEKRGKNTMREDTWLAVCRRCHREIHNNPSAARAAGWLK